MDDTMPILLVPGLACAHHSGGEASVASWTFEPWVVALALGKRRQLHGKVRDERRLHEGRLDVFLEDVLPELVRLAGRLDVRDAAAHADAARRVNTVTSSPGLEGRRARRKTFETWD